MFPLIFVTVCLQAQTDSAAAGRLEVKSPFNEYIQYIYNPHTRSKNLSYNYSNKWDFDNDGKNDSLVFIGNGGAHVYFYLRLKLTSETITREYPTVQLDMPYFKLQEEPGVIKNPATQLIIGDFDKNRTTDIYLNFDNSFSRVPKTWKKAGISDKSVVISWKSNYLAVR
jgi:hypothetical protein